MPATAEETTATLLAMRRQEQNAYKTHDYLFQQETDASAMAPQQMQGQDPMDTMDTTNTTNTSSGFSSNNEPTDPVDVECRFRMAEWCYQIVDFCKFKRETVAVAMSYLDRFLSTQNGRNVALKDRNQFQLAAMTTLYTAVKVHEPEAMEPRLIASLSRGAFTTEQVEQMEVFILNSIQWRVNPPTAVAFCQLLASLIPYHILPEHIRGAVMDLAKFQTELAVSDYDFVTVPPSHIGLSALMNSLESIHLDPIVLAELKQGMAQTLLIPNLAESGLTDIQIRLYEAVTRQPGSERLLSNLSPATACAQGHFAKSASQTVHHESPRSVSQTAH